MRLMTPEQERRLLIALEKEARQCIGKERFERPDLARAVARRMRIRHKGAALQSYRCSHCGKWHVGDTKRIALRDYRYRIRGIRHAG
jgi:hypothetical protein